MKNKHVNYAARGEWVEMQFMARATRHGLAVARPFGGWQHYDFIVEHQGRCARVQVKSTSSYNGTSYTLPTQKRGGQVKYPLNAFEFYALFVVPLDVWYIIPKPAAARAQQRITLRPHVLHSRYNEFMEAWDLLKQTAR